MLRMIIVIILSLWPASAFGQGPMWQEAISRLRETAAEISASEPARPPARRDIVLPSGFELIVTRSADAAMGASHYYIVRSTNIPTLIDRLDGLVQARDERPPEAYVRAILQDQRLLAMAAQTEDPRRKAALLEAVQGSLETKVVHLARAPSSYDVQLQVFVRQGGRPAHGYQVGLRPILWPDLEPSVVLNRESSPAAGEVMPGRYELILRRGSAETRRSPYRIGLAGNSSEVITVSVP